jgi:ATP-dependent RNA helicase DDX31/DBP7
MYRLVNAPTGTGKTIAYLAPLIHHLQGHSPKVDRSHGTFGMCFCSSYNLVFLCW